MQDNGNLAFTVTPNVNIAGTAIPSGTYPLIKYTGTLSGTPPSGIVSLPPGGISASIVNNTGNKSIDLQIVSTVNPPLKWLGGNGTWDTTTANWTQGGGPTLYTDDGTKDVLFDDSASGTSPIMITLNIAVNNPKSVTANNSTKAYVISGTGGINGTNSVTASGAGSLTLATTNTYTGGTFVASPGQLNINYGGTGGADSAIGTGALNLNTGAKIDNTSGHNIALNTATPISVNWIDDWTFVGSTNLDLGLGQVTMGNSQVILTVVSNTLTVNNPIAESIVGAQLVKAGNGALTLSNNANSFTGGFLLNAGTLNLNSDGDLGTGQFGINGGTIDNTSGSAITLGSIYTPPSLINLSGTVVFKGTTNLDLGSTLINVAATTLTVQSNTFTTEGVLDGHNGPGLTVQGSGTMIIAGGTSDNTLNLTITNGGTVQFNKSAGANAVNGNTTTVYTNGTLVIQSATGTQMGASTTFVLRGGKVDMRGDSENVSAVTFTSGTLQNSVPGTTAAFPVATVTLGGASCVFDVPPSSSSLTISNAVGSGGVIKTGAGLLNITTNSYTGNTTISNGTLVLNVPGLATNSTVTVTNGVLNLNFATTNTVAALVLGGVSKSAGVYNASTDPLYITGTGSLQVASQINPLPGPIQFSVSGNTLTLGWPTNLGWILQSQTNTLNTGLLVNSNAWFDVAGSGGVTSSIVTINPTNPAVFFRLRLP
jgi:autotransporter-associated beta strand protein